MSTVETSGGREQAVGHDARRGVEHRSQDRRIVEVAVEVGEHAPVRRQGRVAEHRAGELAQGGRQPEGQELERNGRTEPGNGLVGGHDDHEPIGGRGHDPLAGVRSPSTLDQPAERVHLVGPVDGQVEALDVGKGPDVQPVRDRLFLRGRRRCRTGDVEPAGSERGNQLGHRRTGAQPDPHAALDQRGRRLGSGPLLCPEVCSRHDRRALSCAGRPSRAAPCRCARRPAGRAPVRRGCCA